MRTGEDAHLEEAYEDRYTALADYDQEDANEDEDDYDEEEDEEEDTTDLAPAGYKGRHRAGIL